MTKAEKIKERHQLAIRDYPEQEYERAIISIENAADRRSSSKSFRDLLPETISKLIGDGFYYVNGKESRLGDEHHFCWDRETETKLHKNIKAHEEHTANTEKEMEEYCKRHNEAFK